jgi:hypothetical protein
MRHTVLALVLAVVPFASSGCGLFGYGCQTLGAARVAKLGVCFLFTGDCPSFGE